MPQLIAATLTFLAVFLPLIHALTGDRDLTGVAAIYIIGAALVIAAAEKAHNRDMRHQSAARVR